MFNLRTLWRPKAWVFLGDAGSMLLGITLSWIAVAMSQGPDRVISPSAALWFLMLPIYDAVSMMVRRMLKRRSPFEADREHLHHIFLLAGFSVGETVTLMTGIAIGGVVVGLGATYLGVSDFWLAALFAAGGVLYYWVVRRAWRVMRFLRRSICRRSEVERRAEADRRQFDDPTIRGPSGVRVTTDECLRGVVPRIGAEQLAVSLELGCCPASHHFHGATGLSVSLLDYFEPREADQQVAQPLTCRPSSRLATAVADSFGARCRGKCAACRIQLQLHFKEIDVGAYDRIQTLVDRFLGAKQLFGAQPVMRRVLFGQTHEPCFAGIEVICALDVEADAGQ